MKQGVSLLALTCLSFTQAQIRTVQNFLRSRITEEQRPIIHTFLCVEDCNASNSPDDKPMLEWAEVWSESGWETKVLTETDAKEHPKYDQYIQKLNDAKIPSEKWSRTLGHLAMSMKNGGWYADPSVIPIVRYNTFDGKGVELPNGGKFTSHDSHFDYLLSGDKEAWEMFSKYMIDHLYLKEDEFSLFMRNSGIYLQNDSIIHIDDILTWVKSSVKCDLLNTKVAAHISPKIIAQRSKIDYFHVVNTSVGHCRALKKLKNVTAGPAIHTFFELAFDGKATQELALTDLEEWKKAWTKAGWTPVVVTMADAKKHPKFKEFEEIANSGGIKANKYDQMCFYRWLAVAVAGGGWMADYDTYPLHIDPVHDGNTLPHNGKFTTHCAGAPCLVSGSKSEWNRVIPQMLESLKRNNHLPWSDMFAMQEVIERGYIIRHSMGHGK